MVKEMRNEQWATAERHEHQVIKLIVVEQNRRRAERRKSRTAKQQKSRTAEEQNGRNTRLLDRRVTEQNYRSGFRGKRAEKETRHSFTTTE